MQELKKIIESQQKGYNEDAVFMIGEQLKEIAEREPSCIALLKRDLQIKEMSLEGAAEALQKYADENHGNRKCFVISPARAETILREFYGLSEGKEKGTSAPRQASKPMIDLELFI